MNPQIPSPIPLFDPGVCLITPQAQLILSEAKQDPATYIRRHVCGDWSSMPNLAREQNLRALDARDDILSTYNVPGKGMVWVKTDRAAGVTTILLPSDY